MLFLSSSCNFSSKETLGGVAEVLEMSFEVSLEKSLEISLEEFLEALLKVSLEEFLEALLKVSLEEFLESSLEVDANIFLLILSFNAARVSPPPLLFALSDLILTPIR